MRKGNFIKSLFHGLMILLINALMISLISYEKYVIEVPNNQSSDNDDVVVYINNQ